MLDSMSTSAPTLRTHKKELGAYYSPALLVQPLVDWAIHRPDHSILDPSCGDGIFLEAAAQRLLSLGASKQEAASRLHGVDLNPEASRFTDRRLTAGVGLPFSNIRVGSFFGLQPPGALWSPSEGVDAVIGNPPYIRYQSFAGAERREALGRAARSGIHLNQLASSWAHFVAHALSFLRPQGRLAFILPAELIHTTYAGPLRKELLQAFREVQVISFRQAVFPGVQEEVVLLLAAGKGLGPGRLGLTEVESGKDLEDLSALVAQSETFGHDEEPKKWIPGYSGGSSEKILRSLREAGALCHLSEVGKAGIGFVSGANEYFVLTPQEARAWDLPERSLRPSVIRARQVPGALLADGDMARLQSEGERCLLWSPGAELTAAEERYARWGEERGFADRYKCRVRSPWFQVPGLLQPDAFLTYMSNLIPRLCLNSAGVLASNTLLAIQLHQVPERLKRAFVTSFYNSATLLSCERTGRAYGGGVLKLEPREADQVFVPSVSLISRHRKALEALTPAVDAALREGRLEGIEDIIDAIDQILFSGQDETRRVLKEERTTLRRRRLERAKPARVRSTAKPGYKECVVPTHLELDRVLSRICTALRSLP